MWKKGESGCPSNKFTSETGREAQQLSVASRNENSRMSRIIDENDEEILEALNADMTLKEFQKIAVDGHNQIQRILGLDLSSPRVARRAYQEIVARVKGLPKRQIDLGNADGRGFGITVQTQEDADYIGKVLDGFNGRG